MPKIVSGYSESLLRLFYPLLCKACGDEVFRQDNHLCWRCLQELPLTHFEQHAENPVKHIFTGRLRLQQACSFVYYNKDSITQAIVHRFKYQSEKELGIFMGEMMGQAMFAHPHHQHYDAIIPLPLNERKLRQRGYNQAALLALGISRALGKPVETSAVMRTRYTSTQTKKNRIQRWMNVEHVFDIDANHNLQGKHVLLVDDVITTGATMEAMGQVLEAVPGLQLSLCSLAYASRI
jgi:ComF family protein